ncbi:MAG: hypothetical protein P4M14_06515 [Gammaproteobacteria bacterium]|nr:hypothetical protein [Gammaproteobacteria bacterium]
MPFAYGLSKTHKAKLYISDDKTDGAIALQALYDAGKSEEYEARLSELKSIGHQFRLTDSHVYEIFEDPNKTCNLSIKFLVKGSVITWSFQAPKDQTYQSFRDILYGTAADAHDKVEHGCERYYRGTNAYHLKKMHSHSGESDFNHNHYRRADGQDITPKEVSEHLRAFSNHEHGRFFFPDPAEVDHLIAIFAEYWKEWTYSGQGKPQSEQVLYQTEGSQILDNDDVAEEEKNLSQQEPCRVSVDQIPKAKLDEVRLLRMRGLGSELAHTRQVAGSSLKTVSEAQVVKMGDRDMTPKKVPDAYEVGNYAGKLFDKLDNAPASKHVELESSEMGVIPPLSPQGSKKI